jgi:hypothetical protein
MLLKIDGYITDAWIDTRHKIDYQFTKMIDEKGALIFSDCDDFSASGLHDFFAERALLYNTVSRHKSVKNIAKCFIISMPPGEYPSSETFAKIGDKMLEKMGYSKCPRVMFQHHDTDKAHMHIIVSTITDDLTHVDNEDDYEKSFKTGRELEKEFGYSELKKKTFSKQSFQEIASRRYYFQNALQKALRQDKTGEYTSLFDPDIRQRILRQSLTNEHMIELLGEETYNRVGEKLKENNMFHKYFKAELIDRLEILYQHSQGDDFLKYVKKSGIYVRHVKDALTYGLPDVSFYLNENSLPRKYHYKALKDNRTSFKLDSEQQQTIFESFCNSCYGTPDAFLNRMNNHKVLVKDPSGDLLSMSKNFDYPFGEYHFLDGTVPDSVWIKGESMSKKLNGIPLSRILNDKTAHEYRLSDTFIQPGQAHDDMFSSTLKKAMKSRAVQDRLHQLIPDDVKSHMAKYAMTRNQYQALMSDTAFEAISDILYKGGFYHTFYLESLKKDLDGIFEQASGDRSMFLLLAQESGIKIRLLKNKTFMFEIQRTEGKYRFKENRLPQKFRNINLKAKQHTRIYKLQEEQYHHLFNAVRDCFKDAMTLKDVFTRLSDKNIQVFDSNRQPLNEKTGSEARFGQCLFVDQSNINPVFVSGSSLSKSLSNIPMSDIVSREMSYDTIQNHFPITHYPAEYNFSSVHSRYTPDDDFVQRRKKKRGIGDINLND